MLVPMDSSALFNVLPMENKEIRRANMLALADQFGGLQGLADKTKTDAKYLSQVKNRWQGRGMGDDVARRIEEALGKPRGWMDTVQTGATFGSARVGARSRSPSGGYGLAPILAWEHDGDLPPGDFIQIPEFEVQLSAGTGDEQRNMGFQFHIEFLKSKPLAFRADWIRDQKLRPNKLASMRVSGDSMEERLQDGDAVVIDTSQTR
jgi:hypothetical protein